MDLRYRLVLASLVASGLLVSTNIRGQEGPQGGNSALVGRWSAQRGQSDFILALNADGSRSMNELDLQWRWSGGVLTLETSKRTFRYRASISGDSLTLSGSDLKQPLRFERAQASEPEGLFSSGGSGDSLPIPGNPPLTEKMVDKGSRFFGWLLDAQLTDEQRNQFRNSLIRTWKSGNQDDVQATLNVLKFRDDLQKKSPEERELYRVQLRTKFLQLMRQSPNDVLSQWVLAIYDSAHRPIADGNPPLTRQVTDAYAEFVSFMVTECSGRKAFNADRQFKDALAQNLAARYSSYSLDQQKQFSQVPILWAALRFKWAQLSEPVRDKVRKEWAPAAQTLLSGSSQENTTNAAEASARSSDSTAEHYFVKAMCNSSFATTMSLHLSMWR